jgi:catechol 2,3-dioxygenase-like lactoylglutathione lyase family enzyme
MSASEKIQRPNASYHHVGMRVSDLDRSIHWYEEALGFHVERGHTLGGLDVRVCFMANDVGERVELFEFKDGVTKPEFAHPDEALKGGHAHFALYVDDIQGAFDRAVKGGARVLWGPRYAKPLETETAYIADPDNNLVEFVKTTDAW